VNGSVHMISIRPLGHTGTAQTAQRASLTRSRTFAP
jgi:hypothetical protein